MTRPTILLAAIATLLLSSSLRAAQPICLRILSYNIRHGEGSDNQLDLERTARTISSVNPDIVVLQGVDSGVKRTNLVDQPATLAKLTNMEVIFGDNIPFQGGRYGNAVLSRLPIVRSQNHRLPSFYKGEQRGVFELEVQPPNNASSFLLFATHLDYRPKDEERMASAEMINSLIAERPHTPALLVSDLNSEPCSRVLVEFRKKWNHTLRFDALTYPSVNPIKQIDYVLYRPANRWRVVIARVLDEKVASDHRPVFVVLKLCQ